MTARDTTTRRALRETAQWAVAAARWTALLLALFAVLAHGHFVRVPGGATGARGDAASLLADFGRGRCAAEAVAPEHTRLPGVIHRADAQGGPTGQSGCRAERAPCASAGMPGCAAGDPSLGARAMVGPSSPVQPWSRLFLVHRNLRV